LKFREGTNFLTPSLVSGEEAPSVDEEKDWLIRRFIQWKENVQTGSFSWPVVLIFYNTYVFRGSSVVRFVYFSSFLEEGFYQ
jgi:hypothetical protein